MQSRIEASATKPGRIQTTREGAKRQGSLDSWTHKWKVCASIMVAALVLVTGNSDLHGQSGAGSIQGTVTDSTGAVIQGASIHIVNVATNVASDAKSNGVGFYQVLGLFTGTYTVTVAAPGMKTEVQTIDLLVAQNATIDPKMTPGAVTQQVSVTADTVQLTNTTDGTISSTLENQRINQLPMNGRALLTLAANTVPGLEGGDVDMAMEPQGFEYVADGVSLNNDNFGGQNNAMGGFLPDADAIQEVSFNLVDAPAQYASPGTGVIATKSGTNQLHGSAFETAVNSYFGVARTRTNLATYRIPPYVRNEFGASAGGPVVIPWLYHGKDKTFWFFAYERYSLASIAAEQVYVPTMAERNGDFSGMVSTAGILQTIYDPSTTANNPACYVGTANVSGGITSNQYCRTQYAYNGAPNTINPALESPGAKQIYAITPQPGNTNNPLVLQNLNYPNQTYNVLPTIALRLDHEFNANNKAYLRYGQTLTSQRSLRNYPSNSAATLASGKIPAAASGYQIIPISSFAPAIGYTHVFSPTFFSETVLSQQWAMQYVGGGGDASLDYDSILGLPNNFRETGFPVLNGLSTMNYGGSMYQYQENQIVSEIDENLTKTFGKHQFQFGGRFRHDRFYYLNSRNADTDTFTTYTTGLFNATTTNASPGAYSNTGLGDAGLYLGNVASGSVQLQDPPTWFVDKEIDAYFTDNWHLSRNLTVNLGLRYEAHPARVTRNNVNDAFDLKAYNSTTGVHGAIVLGAPIAQLISEGWTTQAIITNMENIGVQFETPQQAGFPAALYESANLELSPRASLAWQPFGNKRGTVLRGGYGRYIIPVPTRNANPGPIGLPFAYGYTQNYNAANQSPDGFADYPLREVGNASNPNWIVMGQNASGIVNTSTTTAIVPGIAPLSPGYMAPDAKPGQITEVNATLEQRLKLSSALRVSWVWAHGSYLDHDYSPNGAFSTFNWEMITGTTPPNGGASVIGTPQQNTYAATALGPYDNRVYGAFAYDEHNGWSNSNEFQIQWERLFKHGYGFQIYYVYDKAFRIGENGSRDSTIAPYADFYGALPVTASFTSLHPVTPAAVPPPPPAGVASYADYHALERFENYQRDGSLPHHIIFNYVVDLPFGTGKRFLGNSNRFVNELVGGYQIAGVGHMTSGIINTPSGNWGATSPLHLYKHKLPVTDCTSGNCYPEYLWFNGYIPPTQNASSGYCNANYGVKTGASGALECIYGLPTNYTPYLSPINTVPPCVTGCTATNDGTYYNTNDVTVNLANGKTATAVPYGSSMGSNPYQHKFIRGPFNWESDLSLFKVFPITERFNLRFNVDAFNFLNHQGFNNPNSTSGIEQYWPGGSSGATSANPGRQIQLSLRLSF